MTAFLVLLLLELFSAWVVPSMLVMNCCCFYYYLGAYYDCVDINMPLTAPLVTLTKNSDAMIIVLWQKGDVKLYLGRDGYEELIESEHHGNYQTFCASYGNYVLASLSGIRSKPFTLLDDVGVAQTINLKVDFEADGNGLTLVQNVISEDAIYRDRDEPHETCTQPQDDKNLDRNYSNDDSDHSNDNSNPEKRMLGFLMSRTTEARL